MNKTTYFFFFGLIILIVVVMRLLAIRDNNFYFTMDQGRDAIVIRQLLHGQLPLLGPNTTIKGFYMGPLWYYFIALGFVFSGGHPVGGILPLIILDTGLIAIVMLVFLRRLGEIKSLLIGLGLSFLTPFFLTSWYSFNPHLLPVICTVFVFSLSLTITKKPQYFLWTSLMVALCWHSEIAFIPPLVVLWLGWSCWLLCRKQLSWQMWFKGLGIIILFLLPHIIFELTNNFSQTKAVLNELSSTGGVMAKINYGLRFKEVLRQTARFITQPVIALLITGLFLLINLIRKNFNWQFKFVLTSWLLILLAIGWFSLSRGLHDWHLLGLPVILFMAFFISLELFGKKLGLILQFVLVGLNIIYFVGQSAMFYKPSDDQSILANEMATIDWTYQQSQNKGFKVYSFLPSVLDTPYQYLFPWYGQKKYGYLPCEYTTFPSVTARSYVSDYLKYQEKNKVCNEGIFYLIIEPVQDQQGYFDQWYRDISKNSELMVNSEAGRIRLEKRKRVISN